MTKSKKQRLSPGWILVIIVFALFNFGLLLAYLSYNTNIALFSPQGIIAREQHSLMMFTIVVLFAIAIPTMYIAYFIAYKYRETNAKMSATTHSKPKSNKGLVFAMWSVPSLVAIIITAALIPAT